LLSADADLQARPEGPALCNRDPSVAHRPLVKRSNGPCHRSPSLRTGSGNLAASSRLTPSVVCVRSFVPKLKNSADAGDFIRRERARGIIDHRDRRDLISSLFSFMNLSRHLAHGIFSWSAKLLTSQPSGDHESRGSTGLPARLTFGPPPYDRSPANCISGDLGRR